MSSVCTSKPAGARLEFPGCLTPKPFPLALPSAAFLGGGAHRDCVIWEAFLEEAGLNGELGGKGVLSSTTREA